jgi:hypothetical protein
MDRDQTISFSYFWPHSPCPFLQPIPRPTIQYFALWCNIGQWKCGKHFILIRPMVQCWGQMTMVHLHWLLNKPKIQLIFLYSLPDYKVIYNPFPWRQTFDLIVVQCGISYFAYSLFHYAGHFADLFAPKPNWPNEFVDWNWWKNPKWEF